MCGLKLMILGTVLAASAPYVAAAHAMAAPRTSVIFTMQVRQIVMSAWTIMWPHKKRGIDSCFKNLSSWARIRFWTHGQISSRLFVIKVDLGVGVYRDLSGNTPVLACVRRAEQAVLATQTTKSYVAAAGRQEFNDAVEEMVLGPAHAARRDRRARTVQTPGGCGALRVGAELIRAAAPAITVHVSDPTWGNHTPLLGGSGLRLERYPYYDSPRTSCASTRCWSASTAPPKATWC